VSKNLSAEVGVVQKVSNLWVKGDPCVQKILVKMVEDFQNLDPSLVSQLNSSQEKQTEAKLQVEGANLGRQDKSVSK